MMIDVKFHNVERSDALEHFVLEKSSKLEKFLRGDGRLTWDIDFKGKLFNPVLHVLFRGKMWHLHAAAANPYDAIQQLSKRAFRILTEQSSLQRARVRLRSENPPRQL